jgi:hypothetical protein
MKGCGEVARAADSQTSTAVDREGGPLAARPAGVPRRASRPLAGTQLAGDVEGMGGGAATQAQSGHAEGPCA